MNLCQRINFDLAKILNNRVYADIYDDKYAAERAHGAHGGYGYNESFDDLGLDEMVPEEDEGKSL